MYWQYKNSKVTVCDAYFKCATLFYCKFEDFKYLFYQITKLRKSPVLTFTKHNDIRE